MKKALLVPFFVGFMVPITWGALAFLLFNLKEGILSQAFWFLVYVTCPFWLLPGSLGMWLMPALNGAMYVIITLLVSKSLAMRQRKF